MHELTRPMFLFDGDCGVCQNGTDSMRRRFDPPVDLVRYQSIDFEALGVSSQEILDGPVLVRPDGTHVVGPLAIAELLRASRRPYRTIGAAMLLPGIRAVLRRSGPVIYRQRYRLPGSTYACRLPEAPAHVK